MSQDGHYDDDEVRAIIARALEGRPGGGLSHADLLEVGAGVGLSRASIEKAALGEREARLEQKARASVLSRRRRGIIAHTLAFFVVNAFLFAVNYLTTPGEWWVLFPVFAWGLLVSVHAIVGLASGVSARRLEREKARLQAAAVARPSPLRVSDGGAAVRVGAPASAVEDESPPEDTPHHGERRA